MYEKVLYYTIKQKSNKKKKILHGNGFKQLIVEKDSTSRHLRYRMADLIGNLGTIHHIDENRPLDMLLISLLFNGRKKKLN